MDHYVAECLPCRWQEEHAEQEDAILAAEEHVLEHHSRTPPAERLERRIGHVQLRTPGQLATELPVAVPALNQSDDEQLQRPAESPDSPPALSPGEGG